MEQDDDRIVEEDTSVPIEIKEQQASGPLIESPSLVDWFEDMLSQHMRFEAMDEAERLIRYTLDIDEDLSDYTSGIFRHGMFGALADWTGSSIIHHMYRQGMPGGLVDMKLDFLAPGRIGKQVMVESRLLSRGNTLACVSTRFISGDRELASAKTTHYIAHSLKRPISEMNSTTSEF